MIGCNRSSICSFKHVHVFVSFFFFIVKRRLSETQSVLALSI